MGFFTSSEFQQITQIKGKNKLKADCIKCGLYKKCRSPKMKYSGKGKKKILIVGECPSETADKFKNNLVGESSNFLKKKFKEIGISLKNDCWKIDAINCFISSRTPVYTSKGYIPISNVQVGDLVLTHKGRFKKVLSRIHDLPLKERKNTETLINIKTTYVDCTVTANHRFLVNDKWVRAIDLQKGDYVKVLGKKCEICNKIFFPNPYTKSQKICSLKCLRKRKHSDEDKKKFSISMKEQYRKGIRDRHTITKKANDKVRELAKNGKFRPTDNRTKEAKESHFIKSAQKRQRENSILNGIIVGHGEKELGNWFIKKKINFIHQYAIKKLNFDFFLPDYNLLIEVENPETFRFHKLKKIERYKERELIAKENKKDIVFVSSENCIKEVKRILKNHNGEYLFTTTKILKIKKYEQKRQEYLYCLEVEDDHSFVAKGIVHHNCHPFDKDGNNAKPNKKQIAYCRPYVQKIIQKLKPKLIVLAGGVAVQSVVGEGFKDYGINTWRGLIIPDQQYQTNILPIYHPSYLIRNEKDRNLHALYERDLKLIKLALKTKFRKHKEVHIKKLLSFEEVIKTLKAVLKNKPDKIAFDYESTGLKPFRKGHKIVTISFAISSTKAYAFPFDHTDVWTKEEFKEIKELWGQILADKKIKKIGHNIQHENMWSEEFVGEVKGWYWDTMLTVHVLDNREKFTNLDIQVYVNFGERPYSASVKKYLQSAKGTEFNTIEKASLPDLLEYNIKDSAFTFELYERQIEYLASSKSLKKMIQANSFFFKGSLVLSQMQINGSCADEKYYKKQRKKLKKQIKNLRKELSTGREAKRFKKHTGRNIDIGSPKDLGVLFYEVLGVSAIYTTKKNYSVDKNALAKINIPFVKKLLEMRKLEKAEGTYLAQFIRESVDGIIHSGFGLNIPVSYRSSSQSPNWQNIPKRDKIIKLLIRKGIIPRIGCRLVEIDFGGAEVITSAAYHKDKNFINYLLGKGDMHRDIAMDIWKFDKKEWNSLSKEVQKDIRFYAKNMWTFAQFYGDWFGSCAPNLWEIGSKIELVKGYTLVDRMKELYGIAELGEIFFDQLTKRSVITPGSFLEHCQKVERIMWEKRFPHYAKWKDDIDTLYRKQGFIDTYLGFRFQGYMSRNQVCNYPIQGTSFHLLLHTLIKVDKYIRKHKMKTKLIAQIHDSGILDIPENEVKRIVKYMVSVVNNLHKKFKWMVVPMKADIEISELREKGGNFGEMKEYKLEEICKMF